MSLGSKILFTLCGLFLVYMAGEALIQRYVIGPSFTALEEMSAIRDLDRVINTLNREMVHLDTICWDWSSWDDTYAFMIGEQEGYTESNLKDATFFDAAINLFTYVDVTGQVIYSRLLDLETGEEMHLPELPTQGRFPLMHLLPDPGDTENGVVTFVHTSGGLMFIAARNILTSENTGPSRGTLIMGRFLNEPLAQEIAEITQVDTHFLPTQLRPQDSASLRDIGYIKAGEVSLASGYHENMLQISAIILDPHDEPAVMVTAYIPRLMSIEGKKAMRLQFFTAVFGGFVALIVMALLLNSIVVYPLRRLTKHVQLAGQESSDKPFTPLERTDEIGILSKEYSRMIQRVSDRSTELKQRISELRRTQMELRDSEAHLKTILESVQAGILIIDRESHLVVDANAHALKFLNVPREQVVGRPCTETLLCGSSVDFCPLGVVKPAEPAESLLALPQGDKYVLRALAQLTLADREHFLVSFVDITPRKLAENHVRELTHQVMRVQEEERAAISRDLHDNLAQDLNSVAMGLETLLDGNPDPAPETLRKLDRLAATLNRTICEVRDLSYYLRPPEIDRMGLARTLSELCRETSDKHAVTVSFQYDGPEPLDLVPEVEINLFRVAQEALQNVLRHASALHATVRLMAGEDWVSVRVEDDGRGFNETDQHTATARHMGIRSMRERTELLGGRFSLSSLPGQGTVVTAYIPRPDKDTP